MNDPLVDAGGFPRNDIDVYQVRHARHEIICLQNDLKGLMKEIEKGLETFHAENQHPSNVSTTKLPNVNDLNLNENHTNPIVKVNLVSPGSPAEAAGIRLRDEIVEFGSINSNNFQDLSQIGTLVKNCENKNIPLKIKRDGRFMQVTLVPKTWSGRGLLGCNVVPMESIPR